MAKFNVLSSKQVSTRNMKIIHWGREGVRKTEGVLRNYPDILMIDVEGNGPQCVGMKEIPEFLIYGTTDVYEVCDILDEVIADRIKFSDGRKVQTVFIDGMSILWEVRKEVATDKAEIRTNKWNKPGQVVTSADDIDISMREWNIAKRPLKALSTSLANLPVPFIVMSTREKPMTVPKPGSKRQDDVINVGVEMDAMKGLAYEANLAMRFFTDDIIDGSKLIKGPWKCEVTKVQGALGYTMPLGKQFASYPIGEILAHAKNIKPSVGTAKTEMAVAKEQAKRDEPEPVTKSVPVMQIFAQKDLVAYAASKHVPAASLSAALRANPETNPDNWDPKKEAAYKAIVDNLAEPTQ